MHFSLLLLHLAGATLLLLYAVHMVRTGMERAYAGLLRRLFGEAKGGTIRAVTGGAAMAVMLQSSTAVAMIACGFVTSRLLAVPVGLALLLGADFGSALVVRILSFDLGWLVPVCLAVGGIMHLKLSSQRLRETGRMVLGIGFILLSLRFIGEATGPLRHAQLLPVISGYLAGDAMMAVLIGALFTWLIHSSVAAILMISAFAAQGVIPLEAGLPLILGANMGSGLIAFWLSRSMDRPAQRLPLGNLLFRVGAAVVVLIMIETLGVPAILRGLDPATALVDFHLAFNAVLALVCLPFVQPVARLAARVTQEPEGEAEIARQRLSALDRSVIATPTLALASATRELLRMGELVEQMFRPVMDMFRSGTPEQIAGLRGIDDEINGTHTGIKLYIAEVNRGMLTADEARRGIELTDVAINFEYAGDIVAKSLLVLASERAQKALQFSAEGWRELDELHGRVVENMQLALNVLISNDVASARQLVAEKEHIRAMQRVSHERHLRRLQSGKIESIETSDIHLEAVRAFKEINSLLVATAYPLLTHTGDLASSRLVRVG
ncbi:Na+ cotransporter [Mesorhizobium loti]|nr:Na/Pi cotransporter family protein [Mesorhizobium loti]PLP56651.1 Na+ cotransporter [Mesorhizobium loti]